ATRTRRRGPARGPAPPGAAGRPAGPRPAGPPAAARRHPGRLSVNVEAGPDGADDPTVELPLPLAEPPRPAAPERPARDRRVLMTIGVTGLALGVALALRGILPLTSRNFETSRP